MNLKEAYSILEMPQTATPEEAKKKYRELTKKYHPDINKDAGAEDKFKKINEAYQIVSSGKSTDREPPQSNPFSQWRQPHHVVENITINTTISFKEAILGCKQDLKFSRKAKCGNCNGHGRVQLNNGCIKCGGRGQITGQQGHMVFVQTCDKCFGQVQTEGCSTCNMDGFLQSDVSINVTIPGGLQDGNVLRLAGMGNFAGSVFGMEQHTDVHLHVQVTPAANLRLEGMDVVTDLEVSLVEALRGCTKTVKTIMGDRDIDIKPQSLNKDEIIIPRLGVNKVGNQKVVVNVNYPQNITGLIDFLDGKK
jgi:molecular chaperone DnaJ